jgi:Carboxypeptidase regulatory-like domain
VPLHRATVTATDAQGDVAAVVVTDAAGAYAMPGLEPGRYTVVATSHVPAMAHVELADGPVTRVDLDLGAPSPGPRHAAPPEGRARRTPPVPDPGTAPGPLGRGGAER